MALISSVRAVRSLMTMARREEFLNSLTQNMNYNPQRRVKFPEQGTYGHCSLTRAALAETLFWKGRSFFASPRLSAISTPTSNSTNVVHVVRLFQCGYGATSSKLGRCSQMSPTGRFSVTAAEYPAKKHSAGALLQVVCERSNARFMLHSGGRT
jgi:hypothetical protein